MPVFFFLTQLCCRSKYPRLEDYKTTKNCLTALQARESKLVRLPAGLLSAFNVVSPEDGEMAQWVKVFATKPGDPSLKLRTHNVEKELTLESFLLTSM